jgi:tetratricopeptide (TPR) repeat protein
LTRQLISRVTSAACPKITDATRQLYAKGDKSSPADNLIAGGIKLIDNEMKWEEAADMWRKAVLMDKKSAYAYHNLGVYYERGGNIPAAMEEFMKAKQVGARYYEARQYDRSLTIFRPDVSPLSLEPRIHTVSGAGWVSIHGGAATSFIVGREYPVYRLRRMSSDQNNQMDGLAINEVGWIKVVKHEAPFILARITQFIEPLQIESGDVVIMPPSKR